MVKNSLQNAYQNSKFIAHTQAIGNSNEKTIFCFQTHLHVRNSMQTFFGTKSKSNLFPSQTNSIHTYIYMQDRFIMCIYPNSRLNIIFMSQTKTELFRSHPKIVMTNIIVTCNARRDVHKNKKNEMQLFMISDCNMGVF